MKKILVFGGTSFVGRHFEESFKDQYIIQSHGRDADIRNADLVMNTIENFKPDVVINMASVPTIRDSFENPNLAYNVSFHGTENILSSLSNMEFNGKFLYVSSSEVYGNNCSKEGILESVETFPESPYAVAKVAAESLCEYYSTTASFSVNIARPFNHIGPGQIERFAVSNFAKQLVEIYYTLRDPVISIGNLNVSRDFTDVRDVVEAYRLIVESKENGKVYNVCSESSLTLKKMLYMIMDRVGVDARIQVDNRITRKNDKSYVKGSNNLIFSELGWSPKIPIEKTVNDIVEYWMFALKTV